MRAPELDTATEMVFRADAGAPSRPRAALELRPDGSFLETSLGAADRQSAASGTWTLQEGRLVLQGGAISGPARTLWVVSAGPDRLVVSRGERSR